MKFFEKLSFYIDTLVKWMGKFSALLVVVLILVVIFDVLNRYIFNSGSVFLQEIEWHIFDLIFLLGLSYALKHDKHVRVDILYANYSAKTKNILNIFSNIFITIPFSLIIIYYGTGLVEVSFMQNEISPNPNGLCCRYLIKSAILMAFILLVLQSISEVIKSVYKLKIKD
jgi:TRAP-type mannitol/chloroaromatic compound transport system permease small subunit